MWIVAPLFYISQFIFWYSRIWATSVAQLVKNLPAMQETQVWFLGREDPLKEGMASPFSILAWRILWTEEPGIAKSQKREKWLTTHIQQYLWVLRSRSLLCCRKTSKMTELSSVLLKEVCALVAQLIKNLPAMQETLVDSWVGKIPWRKNRKHTLVFLGSPGG